MKLITLCGSVRYWDQFKYYRKVIDDQGDMPLTPEHGDIDAQRLIDTSIKDRFDLLHMEKIRLSDEVWIVYEDEYIGESTKKEIEFARSLNKPIRYLFSWGYEYEERPYRGVKNAK